MHAVILAGGKGSRLKPYTTTIPKPLVPVGDKPILEILMQQLRASGVRKVTLTVNHMAELIMAFFSHGERFGLDIEFSREEVPLGTVGPLKLIDGLPDDFFVLNGDLLMDLDFAELYAAHKASGAKLTVATYQRDSVIDFGVIDVDDSGQVVGFREKPTFHFTVSTGAYVYSKSVLDLVPDGVPFGFDNLMLKMLEVGEPVNTFQHRGYWLDIGRPEDYERANLEFASVFENGGNRK